MNAKVRTYFASVPQSVLVASGLTPESLSSLGSGSLSSLDAINGLPPAAQELVRNAFRNGVRWSFVSLIPWCGLSCIAVLFLSNISDRAMEGKQPGGEDKGAATNATAKEKSEGTVSEVRASA